MTVVIAADPRVGRPLAAALEATGLAVQCFEVEQVLTGDGAALLQTYPVEALVLEVDDRLDHHLALTRAVSGAGSTPILWVTPRPDEVALAALRAGARDLIHPDAPVADQVAAVRRLRTTAVATDSRPRQAGRVLSVLSPKGGVGKTTVATNLAVGLARALPREVVLVDLDVQFGDVASALDLDPEYSVVDTVRGAARQDPMVLKAFLAQHRTGLSVVAGPQSPADADKVTAADAADLLKRLAAEFAFVVVDTAPGLDEHTLAAIDASTDLIMVTSLDVPGIRGLRKELDTLDALGADAARQVVINLVDRHGGLTLADAAATINAPVDVALPRCKTVTVSVNRGVPLLEAGVRNAFTKQVDRLVRRLAPDLPVPVRRRGKLPDEPSTGEKAVSVVPRHALVRRPGRRSAVLGGAA